jgi:hypothetical protein
VKGTFVVEDAQILASSHDFPHLPSHTGKKNQKEIIDSPEIESGSPTEGFTHQSGEGAPYGCHRIATA